MLLDADISSLLCLGLSQFCCLPYVIFGKVGPNIGRKSMVLSRKGGDLALQLPILSSFE